MSNIAQDKKQFRSIVLGLKKLNPSWQAPDISTFLQESENPPLLKRHAPIKRVNRTLKRGEEIPSSLINAPTEKFQKGIIFWGAISSQGLIPATAPINLTEWLRQQPSNGKGPRMYLTGELYGKFVAEKVAPAIQRAFENTHLQPIFQDDQDSKQRTSFAMTTIESFFDERISPEDDDAKFADVWPIERVWGAIKEKIRGKQFKNEAQRKKEIVKQWKNFTAIKCKEMIKKIPNRLRQIIDQDGEQIHDH
ncbi:unnamed protein product [Rotaria sp. Silwood1]|nr:unnamed protein product [Rotaria sp. Silwood1]